MNEDKINQLAERLTNELNGMLNLMTLYLGDRLGLLTALSEQGPATPAELAARAGCAERYVCEWLECLTANDYLDHDPATSRFAISPELAAILLDPDHPFNSISGVRYIPGLAGVLPALVGAFRSGGGVPFEAYGSEFRESIASSNRPLYINELVAKWIPALPDIQVRLQAGARVADFGCGLGTSTFALAKGFPASAIDGLDVDAASIEHARRLAAEQNLSERVAFHLATSAGDPLTGPYDLITAFECIHDMAQPVPVLRRMKELLAPDGAVLIADELVADSLADRHGLPDRLMYGFSVLHCLPQAMTDPGSVATGTMMTADTLRRYATEAGFTSVEVLPIQSPVWRFYRLQ